MKRIALAALLLAPSLAFAQAGANCPTLNNADLAWTQRQGDDYTLCYLELPSAVAAGKGLGVYLGTRSFKPEKNNRAEKGTVGTQQVVWYKKASATRPFSREAIVALPGDKPKSKVRVYVWIDAASQAELNEAFGLAKQLAVK
ncbi:MULTISPECIES: hypothetical protein [unclassified Lysobacter]|uniref:hypothetical protein n=1 Tax=unclassified Lysobacter TaxID=2635362 RepID=UPI0006F82AEE|nr:MULTISPECIES: hypothetical protein [unclassified Lysobacter]KRA17203.1 hypothetical protein ASD69_10820 [Lysobacter sp. Root604]KRD31331.1 hypothetical protein ASE35_15085 [Lysobacter sp. Root916]KRD76882.1 hypothetical protein ASE43_06755 [Lysobacter sp. Root983]